ncbi:hypothetical protein [Scytonema hofmannii]|uniref:hypothetical protein n=1 Tax=Scytonema hofmannii TaxID=34078 RepID=UPI0003479659|nr:hypothetical protein [Scytonema hofmannii]
MTSKKIYLNKGASTLYTPPSMKNPTSTATYYVGAKVKPRREPPAEMSLLTTKPPLR